MAEDKDTGSKKPTRKRRSISNPRLVREITKAVARANDIAPEDVSLDGITVLELVDFLKDEWFTEEGM